MKELKKKKKEMERELIVGQMEKGMKVISQIINLMGQELSIIKVDKNITENGRMVNIMEKEQ